MKKVKIEVNASFDPLGIRQLLAQLGVAGPMLQDGFTTICHMTPEQIELFRNGKGAAHRLQVIHETPAPGGTAA